MERAYFAWPLVQEYCDLRTAKNLAKSAICCDKNLIEKRIRERSCKIIRAFTHNAYRWSPWRRPRHPFDIEAFDMISYLKLMRLRLWQKYSRYKLLRHILHSDVIHDGYHLYLFQFRSSEAATEAIREKIREDYSGSRYDLGKYVLTMTPAEVEAHGI